MIQFLKEEIENLRRKAAKTPEILRKIESEVQQVFHGKILVPKEGIGNWVLYYFCPVCSTQLRFSREEEKEYQCPHCKRIYTGEPFEGAWWSQIHNQNADQCYKMGILYQLTLEKAYVKKGKELLLEYAKYYPGYEVHGDIPCNGPGKAEAQTLDEAVLLRTLSFAYDLIEEALTEEEKKTILEGVLIPGGEFLIEHRNRQIHNHEVIINSAIAVIGILTGKKAWTELAVNGEYGIRFQLEHGVLADGMWFECAFSYHLYAMQSFFSYEKFARHTAYSLLEHPQYEKMLSCILRYMEKDGSLPLINDARPSQGGTDEYQILEFAYSHWKLPGLGAVLALAYPEKDARKTNLEAFLYGQEELKPGEAVLKKESLISHDGSGLTVIRREGEARLYFRHGPYAGEHEHFDKLGIALRAFGKDILKDMGTTGYGAPMHYQYYKNTGTHNTVVINEVNQAPVNATLVKYLKKDGCVYLEASADFTKPCKKPNSYAPVLWDEKAYGDVRMNRKLVWTEHWLAEVFTVEAETEKQIDWVIHPEGNAKNEPPGNALVTFSQKQPFCHLSDMHLLDGRPLQISEYETNGVSFRVYTALQDHRLYQGYGPGNPSDEKISYLVERVRGRQAFFCHVMEWYQDTPMIEQVNIQKSGDAIKFTITEKEKHVSLSLGSEIQIENQRPSHR